MDINLTIKFTNAPENLSEFFADVSELGISTNDNYLGVSFLAVSGERVSEDTFSATLNGCYLWENYEDVPEANEISEEEQSEIKKFVRNENSEFFFEFIDDGISFGCGEKIVEVEVA